MDTKTLRQFELFKGFPPRELNALAGIFSTHSVSAGEKIITQGDKSEGVYLLLSGIISVKRETRSGALVPICNIEPGSLFGTLSTIDGGTRGAHCIAKEDVEYGFLQTVDFLDLIAGNSAMALGFQVVVIRSIFHDIRFTNEQLAEFSSLAPIDELTPIS
ncbi:MAG: cyclic nucleotide-binding domain-containing protein [Myxococcota bacterium]|nr:cyclic nucleotide-binding domain-containing protein [Myxococcota bacterium]